MLGFVNAFKPAGPTSTQFGARLRRFYRDPAGKLAIGHLGTLDPQAAGVLPIALGKATRLLPLIVDRRKGYVCTLVLGRSTATGDAFGETLDERAVPDDLQRRDERREAALSARACGQDGRAERAHDHGVRATGAGLRGERRAAARRMQRRDLRARALRGSGARVRDAGTYGRAAA